MNIPIQHQKSAEHCPCHVCVFLDSRIQQLEAQLPPVNCPECSKSFSRKVSLEAHQLEELHASCYNCGVAFPKKNLYISHMQSHSLTPPSTATHFRCCDCKRDFKSESALANHLRDKGVHSARKEGKNNKKKKEIKAPRQQEQDSPQTGCKKCNRNFKNQIALRSHLSSVRHLPLSNIKCLADTNCSKHFSCPSAQLHHLESGKCLSGISKIQLNSAIASKDAGQIITSGGVMKLQLPKDNLSSSGSSTSQTRSPILTPTSTQYLGSYPPSPPCLTLTPGAILSANANFHSTLTHRLRTQSGLHTCHLCPPSRTRTFKGSALQQHLSSSVHAPVSTSLPVLDNISFHFPHTCLRDSGQKRPPKQFSTVSGLVQHLESGACDGGAKTLRRVIKYVQEEMNDVGFGGLKLLL